VPLVRKMSTPKFTLCFLQFQLMLCWCAPYCRVPIVAEVSKPDDREPSAVVVMPPPSTAATEPSSSIDATKVASGLVACDYVDARASVERVLWFLDRMKNVIDDREGD
jgi:hypothetical protein